MPEIGDIIRASDFNGAGIEAGAVVPFYKVTLSGRYPIFWGDTEANTGWLVCDGGDDLHGGNVPDLRNRFIMGVISVDEADITGGSTVTSETTLTGSTSGTHQHWMFTDLIVGISYAEGTQITSTTSPAKYNRINGENAYQILYNPEYPSRTPSLGLTSTAIGGSGTHTHTLTPPYYSLIYLVKLP